MMASSRASKGSTSSKGESRVIRLVFNQQSGEMGPPLVTLSFRRAQVDSNWQGLCDSSPSPRNLKLRETTVESQCVSGGS